jgi:uncharacterized protein (TIGR04255 family)
MEPSPDQSQIPLGIQLQTLNVPPTPRFWFINESGSELIQVQRDRFIKNWRKIGSGDQYPRYEQLRTGFDQDFKQFEDFLKRNQLGAVRVNQCEVTYINHIVAGTGWETHTARLQRSPFEQASRFPMMQVILLAGFMLQSSQ